MCATNPMGTPYFLLTRSSDSRDGEKVQKVSKPYELFSWKQSKNMGQYERGNVMVLTLP